MIPNIAVNLVFDRKPDCTEILDLPLVTVTKVAIMFIDDSSESPKRFTMAMHKCMSPI